MKPVEEDQFEDEVQANAAAVAIKQKIISQVHFGLTSESSTGIELQITHSHG